MPFAPKNHRLTEEEERLMAEWELIACLLAVFDVALFVGLYVWLKRRRR